MATAVKAYYGITVTLVDHTIGYNLLALLVAVDASLAGIIQNCGQLSVQADDNNGANAVYIGDDAVSANRMAYRLLTHDQFAYRKEAMNVPLGAIWVMGAADGLKLNVEVIP